MFHHGAFANIMAGSRGRGQSRNHTWIITIGARWLSLQHHRGEHIEPERTNHSERSDRNDRMGGDDRSVLRSCYDLILRSQWLVFSSANGY